MRWLSCDCLIWMAVGVFDWWILCDDDDDDEVGGADGVGDCGGA